MKSANKNIALKGYIQKISKVLAKRLTFLSFVYKALGSINFGVRFCLLTKPCQNLCCKRCARIFFLIALEQRKPQYF